MRIEKGIEQQLFKMTYEAGEGPQEELVVLAQPEAYGNGHPKSNGEVNLVLPDTSACVLRTTYEDLITGSLDVPGLGTVKLRRLVDAISDIQP